VRPDNNNVLFSERAFDVDWQIPHMTLTGQAFGVLRLLTLCICAVVIVGCGEGSGNASSFPSSEQTTGEVIELIPRTGPIVAVRVGNVSTLDGSRSYIFSTSPTFDDKAIGLSYHWSFSYKPDGSNAVLQNARTERPSFVADVRGVYIVQLRISHEGLSSKRELQMVIASVAPERLTGRFFHQGLSSNCANCHLGDLPLIPGISTIPGKLSDHLATSDVCEGCHSPLGFADIVFVDHLENFGACRDRKSTRLNSSH
jgi:hypothetical protein